MPGKIVRNFKGFTCFSFGTFTYLFFHIPLRFIILMTSFSLTVPERINDKSYAQVVGKANILLAEIGSGSPSPWFGGILTSWNDHHADRNNKLEVKQ